jgi:hypothetical protein
VFFESSLLDGHKVNKVFEYAIGILESGSANDDRHSFDITEFNVELVRVLAPRFGNRYPVDTYGPCLLLKSTSHLGSDITRSGRRKCFRHGATAAGVTAAMRPSSLIRGQTRGPLKARKFA